MGWGVPEAGRQCYNSPMNSDLSGRTTRTRTTRAKMPFLGRTLDRGPTKTTLYVWDIKYISNIKTLRRITYHSLLGSNIKIKPKVAKIIMARKGVESDPNSFLKYSWIYMAHMCIFSSLTRDYSSIVNLVRKIKLVNLPDHIYQGTRLINKKQEGISLGQFGYCNSF